MRAAVGGHLGLHLLQLRIGLPILLGLDLAVEFELAQIAEERAFLRRELIGFALQGLDALCRARGERLGPRAIGRLRREREPERRDDDCDDGPADAGHRSRRRADRRVGGQPDVRKSVCHRCPTGSETPKYFNTVGAMSMIRVVPARTGRLEISVPAVCL